jgi:hypothetical protein
LPHVFRIITGVVARVVAEVVARVVAGGDEAYQHHSSARVVDGGHSSPMKGWGQICSNEEQIAFPLLICNQILYHVFSVNRNPNLMIFVSDFF